MGALRRVAYLVLALQCVARVPRAGERSGEKLAIDEKAKTVTAAGAAAKQAVYDVLKGAIEYAVVAKGGKEYETLFTLEATPDELCQALLKIGLQPGEPAREGSPPRGQPVHILVECEADGQPVRRALDEFVLYLKTGRPVATGPWTFTGSAKAYDPTTNKDVIQAALSKSIVGLHWMDTSPLLQNPRPEAKEENLYKANAALMPKPGTPVRLIFEAVAAKPVEGAKRVHVLISGRVQGVGFRAFTEREARVLKLTGWVKNLPDGRVEAIVEGPKQAVDALLAKVRQGPRSARVEKCEEKEEPATGEFQGFETRY